MGGYEEALDAFRSGENERARALSEALLAASREAGDVPNEVDALCMLARVALRVGELERVRDLAAQARACAAGDPRLRRMPLHMQAVAARMSGDRAQARVLYEESIELNRSLGEERMVAAELHNLAYVELHERRTARAIELFADARAQARRIGYEALNAYLVGDLAVVAAATGDDTAAARLAGAAAAAFAAEGHLPDPDDAQEQARLREQLVASLGIDAFQASFEEGARLTPAEILGDPGSTAEQP